jgi:hypothetical protein
MRHLLVMLLGVLVLAAAGHREASALPVFSEATAVPDAISPNGDGVQDESIITYRVAVDSADVRILVTDANGAIVDTLQVLTRQGAGLHATLFPRLSVPDGIYEIRIFGVGTRGEGTEEVRLPVLVDRVPPAFTLLALIEPDIGILQNGDALLVRACFAEPPDSVTIDFSELDSNYDPDGVETLPSTELCTEFAYTISLNNLRSDAAGLRIPCVAFDRAGNRAQRDLLTCLSNSPPALRDARLLNASSVFQNGDRIRTQYTFVSPNPLTVSAQLGNFDSGFNPNNLIVEDLGNQTFVVEYVISEQNIRPDGTYPFRVIARDIGCGIIEDESITITLDNEGQVAALVTDVHTDTPAFSPRGNGIPEVEIAFTVLEDSTSVTIIAEVEIEGQGDPDFVSVLRPTLFDTGPHSVSWDGSVPGVSEELIPDQIVTLTVRAISISLDRQRSVDVDVELDSTPPAFLSSDADNDDPLRNGELARFSVTFDDSGYVITPDFSNLDSTFDPDAGPTWSTQDQGEGAYEIAYGISPDNARPDGNNKVVPVMAEDVAGNTNDAADDLVRLCLSNAPPEFVAGRLVSESTTVRNGDRIAVEASFRGGFPAYRVSGDFSAVDTAFDPEQVSVNEIGEAEGVFSYRLEYTISNDNELELLENQPLLVTARDNADSGCGSVTDVAARITLDNQRPPQPVIDRLADPVVREGRILISGLAPGGVAVEAQRNGAAVDTFDVDLPDSTFSGWVPLEPGENEIQVVTLDGAGNRSSVSRPVEAFFLQTATFIVPNRFRPGSEFFLGLVEPANRVVIRIFDLEGTEIKRLEEGSGDLYRIPWDGLDHLGSLTSSGPYFVVAEVDFSGSSQMLRDRFVFTRR